MRTDFSEFSFGYALVEALMRAYRPALNVAPIFPSLIEEGRAGGGYDVKLDAPGVPLLIQFKRPDVMKSGRAKEVTNPNCGITPPFYRFHVRSSAKSRQHDLLLAHESAGNEVYYASPCFHETADFNSAYSGGQVIRRTIFVRPRDIGPLSAAPHHVAYKIPQQGWICSDDPRKISARDERGLVADLEQALAKDKRPLEGLRLRELVQSLDQRLSRAGRPRRPIPTDLPSVVMLRTLAELSQVGLGCQLFIVQREPE